MKNLILIAPPGAGKGTQSKMLVDKYNYEHISTGDLLREISITPTEIGKYIKEQMQMGNLVGDNVILDLLKDHLKKKCDHNFILDGFPRNIKQAINYNEMLKELNIDLGLVIVLDVDKETLKARITGRLLCNNCGAIYNDIIKESKPINEGICDKCNSPLTKRVDDNIETFENRYRSYLDSTTPLIEYYENLGILYRVDCSEKTKIFNKIEKILGCQND